RIQTGIFQYASVTIATAPDAVVGLVNNGTIAMSVVANAFGSGTTTTAGARIGRGIHQEAWGSAVTLENNGSLSFVADAAATGPDFASANGDIFAAIFQEAFGTTASVGFTNGASFLADAGASASANIAVADAEVGGVLQ